ncbi:helix-turn-helix domain-containing protein [Enterococcus lactis]|nr:helix-turn-helix domain-containing protein [Enterococcus lactis]
MQRSYYSMIESGKRSPSPFVAMKIATVLSFDWTIFLINKVTK